MRQQGAAIRARALRVFILGLAFALLGATALAVLRPQLGPFILLHRDGGPGGTAIAALGTVVFALALAQMEHTLRHIERGSLFDARVVRGLRRFAAMGTSGVLIGLVGPWISSASGGGTIRLVINLRDVVLLAVCLIFYVIAAIVAEGARIEADNRAII